MPRLAVLLLLLAAVGCDRGPAPSATPYTGAHPRLSMITLNSRAAALCAAHPFWRVPVERAQVEELVQKVRGQEGEALVFVDDHFKVVVEADPEKVARSRESLKGGGAAGWPEGLSERRFYLDTARLGARPSTEKVLDALEQALDAADKRR
jgi:hypothetical protein